MSEVDLRLVDMLAFALRLRRLIANKTRAAFDADEPLMLATTLCIQVIGEAASRVAPDVRDKLPGIEWKSIIRMRNLLVLDYGRWNFDVVWNTATESVPELIARLEAAGVPSAPPSSKDNP